MSMEEEVELRDLVAQTLEVNGVLPKIRAQLRANLFLTLNEDPKISKEQPLLNQKLKSQLELPEGQLMFSLVRDFLEYFNLDFSISVFEAESCEGSCYKYLGRKKVLEELGFDQSLSGPVLLELVKIAQTKSKTNRNENGSISSDVQCDSEPVQLVQKNTPSNNKENCLTVKKLEMGPLNSTYTRKDIDNDDTFNGTSSIEEESVNGAQQHNSDESSPDSSKEKSKNSQKIKSKLDLSPRGSDILPSLYNNKDFKDKNKEFDIKDDYEEDFMSGSELDCPMQLGLQSESQNKKKSTENSNSSTKTSDIHTNLSLDCDSNRSQINS